MSTDNQSSLRFSLEESVWFQRGQEVAELISISLDPDITIQEDDQYVTIQGSLELSGEYTCADVEEGEEPAPQAFAREVQSIEEGEEEGQFQFIHRFPVDITIPQNRIESIYDIDIAVESFDYDLPSRNNLKLSAELAITGLYGEQQHGSEEETEQEEPASWFEEAEEEERQPETPEEVPIFQEPERKEPQWQDWEEVEIPSFQELRSPLKEEPPVEEPEAQEEEKSLYEPFKAEAKKEPTASEKKEPEPLLMRSAAETEQQESPENEDVVNEESERKETPKAPAYEPIEEAAPHDLDPVSVETEATVDHLGPVITQKAKHKPAEEEESSSSSSFAEEESPKGKKKSSKKKGLSIAEFLARKEETEVATLRVCIVQQDDTLQQIADRYDVSVQHILNLNHLGLDQEVAEGQVLYVPVKYAEKK